MSTRWIILDIHAGTGQTLNNNVYVESGGNLKLNQLIAAGDIK